VHLVVKHFVNTAWQTDKGRSPLLIYLLSLDYCCFFLFYLRLPLETNIFVSTN